MNPDTLQFQCGFCRTILTVPAQMAGISGPCPSCGQTVTSPMPAPVAAAVPQWTPPPVAEQAPAAWPPAPAVSMQGDLLGQGQQSPVASTGLPPRRSPGQPPLTATLNAPGNQMPWASAPAPAAAVPPFGSPHGLTGNSDPGFPNHSRLIPGAPALPNMPPMGGAGGMPGMLGGLSGASLLGRDISSAPSSSGTQPLHASGAPALSLGGAFGHDSAAAPPITPIPAGRSIAHLRTPRGTNYLRLAFAAVFLLGFLGLVGVLLKDYLPGFFPGLASLVGQDVDEETAKEAPDLATPSTKSGDQSLAAVAPPETKPKPAPITVGFDPQESVPSKAAPATMGSAAATSLSPAVNAVAEETKLPASAGATLLEVPAKSALKMGDTASSPTSLGQPRAIEEQGVPAAAKPAAAALTRFLAAKSLEERLPYTLGADLMKPLMERYYSRAPDGPVLVDRIQFVRMDPNPELGSGKHCIFSLENKTWDFSVPVMLEEKADGFKVDWVAFVEFKDRLLEKFFQTYQDDEPRFFHVGIIRHHYFEDGIPNLDHKDAFRVSPAPPDTFQASVFLDKNSKLAEELRSRMPWETHVWAVVGLQWKKLGSQQWVELKSVPQMHWYSLPMTAKSSATAPKASEVVEDMPPGISRNGVSGKTAVNTPPPGIRKSTPDLPITIKRPISAGR